ncbi:hypothetical protein HON36_05565 [Candidatus Parcubacteria bacterium]|jgi:hypothetical protein|nr:hypothetical protein [Candidatus Parcubacteria bacterium]MBT7227932.1 hypothetical protein [Candidatus Parcubacteria bacterium]
MPNIEMHGFQTHIVMPEDDVSFFRNTKNKIHEVIRKLELTGEAVITIHNTTVERCDGSDKPAPYLRVCGTNDTDDADIEGIVEALIECEIAVDCETLTLDDFYPDVEMGAEAKEDDSKKES